MAQTVHASGVRMRYVGIYICGGWCVGEAGAWLEVKGDGGRCLKWLMFEVGFRFVSFVCSLVSVRSLQSPSILSWSLPPRLHFPLSITPSQCSLLSIETNQHVSR